MPSGFSALKSLDPGSKAYRDDEICFVQSSPIKIVSFHFLAETLFYVQHF